MPQYISKLILNGVTQMDVTQDTVAANNLLLNETATGADGAPVVGAYVPSVSTDFVVTIDYDSQDDTWKPNRTLAEIQAAYTAGKTIAVINAYCDDGACSDGWYQDHNQAFLYTVSAWYDDVFKNIRYILDSNGIDIDETVDLISPHFETVSKTYTPTASTQTEIVMCDSNIYNGLRQVNVTVNATPSAGIIPSPSSVYLAPSVTVDPTDGLVTVNDVIVDSIQPIMTAGWVDTSQTFSLTAYVANTLQLPTQAATTITPTTSSQTAVAAGKYTTGAVTVAAMPSGSATPAASISATGASVATGTNTLTLSKSVSNTPQVSAGYVSAGTAGNSSVSLTASVTTKAATTYHPSSSQQTIASGTYLTGTQTINAVTTTNLTADNIKSGVVVQVGDSSDSDCVTSVTGTYTGGGGGSGLTLLKSASLGTLSTTSTSATDTGKSMTVTGYNDYDVLVVDVSVDTATNGRHTSTVSFVILTGTSNVTTKNTYTVGSNKWNSKLSSSGTASTRQSTSAYGIYANSATVSGTTMTIPFYYRYNSNNTGTINGSYTARVYGLKLIDLIGG